MNAKLNHNYRANYEDECRSSMLLGSSSHLSAARFNNRVDVGDDRLFGWLSGSSGNDGLHCKLANGGCDSIEEEEEEEEAVKEETVANMLRVHKKVKGEEAMLTARNEKKNKNKKFAFSSGSISTKINSTDGYNNGSQTVANNGGHGNNKLEQQQHSNGSPSVHHHAKSSPIFQYLRPRSAFNLNHTLNSYRRRCCRGGGGGGDGGNKEGKLKLKDDDEDGGDEDSTSLCYAATTTITVDCGGADSLEEGHRRGRRGEICLNQQERQQQDVAAALVGQRLILGSTCGFALDSQAATTAANNRPSWLPLEEEQRRPKRLEDDLERKEEKKSSSSYLNERQQQQQQTTNNRRRRTSFELKVNEQSTKSVTKSLASLFVSKFRASPAASSLSSSPIIARHSSNCSPPSSSFESTPTSTDEGVKLSIRNNKNICAKEAAQVAFRSSQDCFGETNCYKFNSSNHNHEQDENEYEDDQQTLVDNCAKQQQQQVKKRRKQSSFLHLSTSLFYERTATPPPPPPTTTKVHREESKSSCEKTSITRTTTDQNNNIGSVRDHNNIKDDQSIIDLLRSSANNSPSITNQQRRATSTAATASLINSHDRTTTDDEQRTRLLASDDDDDQYEEENFRLTDKMKQCRENVQLRKCSAASPANTRNTKQQDYLSKATNRASRKMTPKTSNRYAKKPSLMSGYYHHNTGTSSSSAARTLIGSILFLLTTWTLLASKSTLLSLGQNHHQQQQQPFSRSQQPLQPLVSTGNGNHHHRDPPGLQNSAQPPPHSLNRAPPSANSLSGPPPQSSSGGSPSSSAAVSPLANSPQPAAGSLVANINCNKIRGHVTLTPNMQGGATITTQISAGPPGEVYQWSIHQFPVKPGAAQCTCSPLILGSKLIDLSEMHGNLPTDQEFNVQSSIGLFGFESPVGHSLLLRGIKTGMLACATFLPTSRKSNYRAKFHSPISGSVTIFQTAFGTSFISHLMYSNGTRRHSIHRFDLVRSDDDVITTSLLSGSTGTTTASSSGGSTGNSLGQRQMDSNQLAALEQREHDNELGACKRFTSGEPLFKNITHQLSISTENFGMRGRTSLVLPQIPFETFSSVYVVIYSEFDSQEPIACAPLRFVKPKTAAAKFQSNSVQGSVVFSQESPYDTTLARVNLNFPNSDGHSYGIDELPMIIRRKSDTRVCPNIREIIYNPHHVEPSSVPPEGEATSDQYAVGDLSGKYGSLTGKANEKIQVNDYNLPLFGPVSIIGRALTIYSAEGVAIACSNVELTTPMTTAFATFDYGIQGQFIFRQPTNDCNGDTYVYIEVSKPTTTTTTGAASSTSATGVTSPAGHGDHLQRSLDHNWHIHVNPVDSGLEHLSTTDCSPAGGHFNPYNTSTASIYSRDCTPFNVLRCELGDLSAKMFTIEIPPYRVKGQEPDIGKFFGTDIDLPLCGPVSIVNRSVVVHVPDFGSARLACSTVIEFKPRN